MSCVAYSDFPLVLKLIKPYLNVDPVSSTGASYDGFGSKLPSFKPAQSVNGIPLVENLIQSGSQTFICICLGDEPPALIA